MCGLCGFTGKVDNKVKAIEIMTDLIVHRGPDNAGYFADKDISMGFRRLSIVDLDGGNQPIYNETNTLVLNFNGEIYNYQDIKEELIKKGHKFYTKSDSEVIIHGFEEWGHGILNKLRGMFAFAIWDRDKKSLFLARDFFGIKPLHYAKHDDNFIYASEIKSILVFPGFKRNLNKKTLDRYLSFQYAVPPETFFEGIYCLLPGHYMTVKDGEIDIKRYFKASFNINENLHLDEAVKSIENVFKDSIEAHKISDVEVGCFLSSGIDSSYISSYFPGQKAFTVGFEFGEKYNESSWAKNLSKITGLDHHYKLITSEEFWGNVEKVQYYMDQPLADPSCVALYFVCKLASKYVKVVLSGEGADEFFGGYTVYNEPQVFRMYQKIVPQCVRTFLSKFVKKIPFYFRGQSYIIRGEYATENKYIGNAFIFTFEDKQKILKDSSIASKPQDLCSDFYKETKNYDDVTKMQYLDINLWLVGDILLKADRMSMANSLELRVPFLDKEVFNVASTIPANLKINKENTKYTLRIAASKKLPENTANKEKLGFPVPTRIWLRDQKYYEIVKKVFCSKIAQKFFNTDEILKFLEDHYKGKWDNSRKIWTIYTFIIWYNIYFSEEV
ncbi:MAG: asparagine synthase (glutamine-hydrolyzing) [Oscillospiraceae bacterium]|jgi:asparagine synthase (glutamine-hydrolysing)|nr:asparagine synthase (glutamine-hydrolyzing) [Oscillospiraceae bacterium]